MKIQNKNIMPLRSKSNQVIDGISRVPEGGAAFFCFLVRDKDKGAWYSTAVVLTMNHLPTICQ